MTTKKGSTADATKDTKARPARHPAAKQARRKHHDKPRLSVSDLAGAGLKDPGGEADGTPSPRPQDRTTGRYIDPIKSVGGAASHRGSVAVFEHTPVDKPANEQSNRFLKYLLIFMAGVLAGMLLMAF